MTPKEMLEMKERCGYSYALLSEKSGVPVPTIQKVLTGQTEHPRYQTMSALCDAFDLLEERNPYRLPSRASLKISEAEAAYDLYQDDESSKRYPPIKKQGEYTIEDYYEWPEDDRIELIDGVIYDMTAPSLPHQIFAGEAYRRISNFILERGGPCRPFISPVDVQLDRDDKTMVQPDVAIVCDPSKEVNNRVIYGAPDFVLEVVSPSSQRKDHLIKLKKYKEAGVREYWVVDPQADAVYVYLFMEETIVNMYSLFEEIPVRIYNGELSICFETIRSWL